MENTLEKGKFLSQRKLAVLTGTSVVSVREALKRLEYENLIEMIPKWGVRIPEHTRDRIIQLYAVREGLEVMVAYILSQRVEEIDADSLHRAAAECDRVETDTPEGLDHYAMLHRDLHLMLAQTTENKILKTELERLRVRSLLFQSDKVKWQKNIANPKRWHQELIEEILSGDAQRAETAMHRHVQHGLQYDLEIFDHRDED